MIGSEKSPTSQAWIREAIKRHPETFSGEISVAELGEGENNKNYKVSVGGEDYVFRTTYRKELEDNLVREYHCIEQLPPGIGPKPVLLDTSKEEAPHNYAVYKYLPGAQAKNWTDELIKAHAKQLAILHNKKYDYYEKRGMERTRATKQDLLAEYDEAMEESKAVLERHKALQELHEQVRDVITANNHLFTEQKAFSLLHGDLNTSNIIVNEDQVHYVDWEWSRIGDPANDLALFYCLEANLPRWYAQISKQQEQTLLETYEENTGEDKTLRERIRIRQINSIFSNAIYFQNKLDKEDYNTLNKEEMEEDIQESKRAVKQMLEEGKSLFATMKSTKGFEREETDRLAD